MKKIYILAIFMVLGFGLFAQTVTKVTKTILPLTNSLPVVYQENISGGVHQVANITARNDLSPNLKQTGMLVILQDTHATYQWDGAAWRKVQLVRNWEEGATYFSGDIFVYFGNLVIARGDGTITASYNPLTDTNNWYSSLGASLGAGQILVGDANGVAQSVTMSGDALLDETGKLTVTSVPLSGDLTLDATGAATLSDGKVTSAKILDNTIATADLANGAVTVAKIGSEGGTDKVLTTTVAGVPQWENRTNFASSKLTAGHIFVGDAQDKATDVPMGGDIKINNSGMTDIFPGVIVDGDVSSSAAILGTKIKPDFGSQDVVTTGNMTGKKLLVGQTNTVTLQNAASLSSSYTLTLPDALGAAGQSLKTDASGNLSWGTALVDGTAADNTLRWNGTSKKWEESTALKNDGTNLTASGNLNVTGGVTTLSHATSDPLLLTGAGFKSQMATNAYSELVVDNTTGAIRKAPVITALSDVVDNTVSNPSALSPNINDAWIVAAPGAGAWAGHDNAIAKWNGSSWVYYSPAANDQTSVSTGVNAGKVYTWSGTAWSTILVASKSALSQVTAATATNLIDNTNFAQTWNWSSATTENPLTFNTSALTSGTAMQINANALTTGSALSISSGSTGLTTGGSLLNIASVATAATGKLLNITSLSTGTFNNGGVSFSFSGDHKGAGFRVYDVTTTGTAAQIAANSITTGKGLSISADALTSGMGLELNSNSTSTIGRLLYVNSSSTSAFLNGGVNFNFGGAHTGSGFQLDDATQAGTAMSINADALTSGKALSISSGSSSVTGNLLRVISTSTSTFTNGGINFIFSGDHKGTGFLVNDITTAGTAAKIIATQLTTGTGLAINANALTTGNALSIASTGTGITSGSLLNVSGAVAATTVTNGLFSVVNTAATSSGTVATIQANSTPASGITVLANGFVGIGTAAPTVALDIVGDAKVSGTFSYPSDIRLKTKVETLTGVLSKLAQMRGVTYEFKDQTKYAKGPQVGVIAQELQKVFPELVKEGSDGFLSVNYTQLSAVLIQAVKEQQARIDKLEEQMAAVMKQLGMK